MLKMCALMYNLLINEITLLIVFIPFILLICIIKSSVTNDKTILIGQKVVINSQEQQLWQ